MASIDVELSVPVQRFVVSLFVAYDLKNPSGFDDSKTLAAMPSGSLTVDVDEGGFVIAAVAMAGNLQTTSLDVQGLSGSGFVRGEFPAPQTRSRGLPTRTND